MDEKSAKEFIARRVARELRDGDVVNLGIGLPTLIANYLPDGRHILLQSENGILGMGADAETGRENRDVVNAGGQCVTVREGGMFFDSACSFGLIRGGHVDACVLGALEVDAEGNLANWIIPGKLAPGMGGAMDLVCGAKKVIVAMLHTAKGKPKIVEKCTLPLTAAAEVDMIVTEYAVIEITPDGLELREINPAIGLEELQAMTGGKLIVKSEPVAMGA